MAYGVDDRTTAVEELAFLARMRDWARQWGEREYYYIRHEDLEYAVQHDLCTVLILNQLKYYEGYRFYKNMIQIDGRYFVNTDRRNLGH